MLSDFIAHALPQAEYEWIDSDQRVYAEVPKIKGAWAEGESIEECRASLIDALEVWYIATLQQGGEVPSLGKTSGKVAKRSTQKRAKVYA